MVFELIAKFSMLSLKRPCAFVLKFKDIKGDLYEPYKQRAKATFGNYQNLLYTYRSANITSYIFVVLDAESFCRRNCLSHIGITL